MSKTNILLTLFASTLMLIACSKTEDNAVTLDCTNFPVSENTYSKTIKPIMDGSCATAGCHTANARAGGVALNTYATVKNSFVNGKGLCSIKHTCVPMPENGSKLSNTVINRIECWVKSGAPE